MVLSPLPPSLSLSFSLSLFLSVPFPLSLSLSLSFNSAGSSVPWTSPLHSHLNPSSALDTPPFLILDLLQIHCLTKLSSSSTLVSPSSLIFLVQVPLLAPEGPLLPAPVLDTQHTHTLSLQQLNPPTLILSGYILLANLPSEPVGALQLFTFPLVLDLSVHCSSFVAFSPAFATVVAAYHHSYLPWSSSPRSHWFAPGLDKIPGPLFQVPDCAFKPLCSLTFGLVLPVFSGIAAGALNTFYSPARPSPQPYSSTFQ